MATVQQEERDPHSGTTLIVGLISVILLLAIIVAAQVLFYGAQRIEDESKLYAPQPQELLELQSQQLAEISGYKVIDKQTGRVAIPIERAIEIYAREVQTGHAPPTMKVAEPTTQNAGPGFAP